MQVKYIEGGVTAAKGFSAAGLHCGIRKNRTKKDLALILSATEADGAAVYTQNKVKGAPLLVTKQHLEQGTVRAVVCNSGIANTCAADGVEKAQAMCRLAAEQLGIDENKVLVASTGVIGPSIDLEPIQKAMPDLCAALSEDGSSEAAQAIMTTDTKEKSCAVEFTIGGKTCRMGGIAKGSGMIHPNMATMLCFITTDAAVEPAVLQTALRAAVADTFNMLSVDGDTSTNDMVTVLANGASGAPRIAQAQGEDYEAFFAALQAVCTDIVRKLAADGEGAGRLIEAHISGGATVKDARAIALSVIQSSLLKAAMFGADANWGRVLCAIGYADAQVDIAGVDVDFRSAAGTVAVCRSGAGIPFDEDIAKKVLSETEIHIDVTLHDGEAAATAYGCDLTYEYVRINGDYRS